MLKFPQLLFLLMIASQARAGFALGGLQHEPASVAPVSVAQKDFSVPGSGESGLGLRFVAIPEPGVFVALISGATILLARRRR